MAGNEDFFRIAATLREMPTDVRRGLRPALQQAAAPIIAKAKVNASWSRRIPGAIRLSVLKRGVAIRVSSKRAPHARPYEGVTGGRTFRHPLFGDRDSWYAQRTRPFLEPAVLAHRSQVRQEVARVVDRVARLHGFK